MCYKIYRQFIYKPNGDSSSFYNIYRFYKSVLLKLIRGKRNLIIPKIYSQNGKERTHRLIIINTAIVNSAIKI